MRFSYKVGKLKYKLISIDKLLDNPKLLDIKERDEIIDIIKTEKTPDIYFIGSSIVVDLNFIFGRVIYVSRKSKIFIIYQEENRLIRYITSLLRSKEKIAYDSNLILLELIWGYLDRIENFVTKMQKKIKDYNLQISRELYNLNPAVLYQIHIDIIALLDLKHDLSYFLKMLERKRVLEIFKSSEVEKVIELEEILNDFRELLSFTEMAIEMAKSFMDTYDALAYRELNFLIKRLTSFSIILMVLELIPAIYGMNVLLPLANKSYAFPVLILLMLSILFILVYVFKKIKYL